MSAYNRLFMYTLMNDVRYTDTVIGDEAATLLG